MGGEGAGGEVAVVAQLVDGGVDPAAGGLLDRSRVIEHA
jgi:hypothetical protein